MRHHRLVPLVLVLGASACDKGDDKPASAQGAAPAAKPGDDGKPNARAEAKAPPPEAKQYGGEFCAVIVPCYEKLEFNGNFSADVTVDIGPDGHVTSVSYSGGAPKPIESCIIDTIKPIVLEDYNGKPGRTHCTQSGQLSGGTRMVMADMKYEIREPGDDAKADDDAEADTEADADAKAEGDAKAE